MATNWSWIGTAFDWLGENEWFTDLLSDGAKTLMYDQPELDIEKLMELAINEATINSPDVYGPAGSSTTTIDPETGKRVVTQKYSPEVQQLFDMLLRNAGSQEDTYRKPGNFDAIQGKLINNREEYLGLPQSTYTPWQNSAPRGTAGITLQPGSDADPEDD